MRTFFRAFSAARLIVFLLTVGAGGILLAISALDNALHYTKTMATVERVGIGCYVKGVRAELVACAKSNVLMPELVVRYLSPADSRTHVATLPIRGRKAGRSALKLRAGDRWEVYAHDDQAEVIKAVD